MVFYFKDVEVKHRENVVRKIKVRRVAKYAAKTKSLVKFFKDKTC